MKLRRILRKFIEWRQQKLKERFKKKLVKYYGWYDYTFLYELIGDWLDEASVHYEKSGFAVSSKDTAKEMRIASTYAKYIANDKAWENVNKRYYNIDSDVVSPFRRQQELEMSYLESLFHLMYRKSLTWWD